MTTPTIPEPCAPNDIDDADVIAATRVASSTSVSTCLPAVARIVAPMTPLRVALVGIGAWAAGHAGWPALVRAFGDGACDASGPADATSPAQRPSPGFLPAAERRRMPDGVAVALEVAREAVSMAAARIDATRLASVFASAYGDLAIVDYLCDTLATDAALLSPTRFHLSVHNAAAGYWSIGARDLSPTSAIAAGEDSFATGLLEAVTLALAERRPVLLVAFDTAAVGLVARVTPNSALFGFALVVAPLADGDQPAADEAVLALTVEPSREARALPLPRRTSLHALAASSAAARALALAEAIAGAGDGTSTGSLRYPLGNASTLAIAIEPATAGPWSIGGSIAGSIGTLTDASIG